MTDSDLFFPFEETESYTSGNIFLMDGNFDKEIGGVKTNLKKKLNTSNLVLKMILILRQIFMMINIIVCTILRV